MAEHDKQADELEAEADTLEERSQKLESEIEDVRSDWDSKQRAEQVPGAVEEGAAAPGGAGEPEPDARVEEEEGENPAKEAGGPA